MNFHYKGPWTPLSHNGHATPLQLRIAPLRHFTMASFAATSAHIQHATDDADPRRMSDEALQAELLAPAGQPGVCGYLAAESSSMSALAPVASAQVQRKLSVARELLQRTILTQLRDGPLLRSPELLEEWLTLRCAGLGYEVFFALYLDAQNRLIEAAELFRGTLTQVNVYPREVVKDALRHGAAAVVVAHNHPSGSSDPSHADRSLTDRLRQALALVEVRVLDHFVVGHGKPYSFARAGLL